MQRDSEVAALIPHTMDTQLVSHIGDGVFLMCLFGLYLHEPFLARFRELVSRLGQVAPQDLHQAMGVSVVVDGTSLSRTPDEHKLVWL